uniref:Uncharacterized protein n=1 Tax=Ignisphaera aggregans TaxID=334771 RepID=A0A7C2ZMP0_9CREN
MKRALVDMHEISLDVPPYPQLNNFIEIYLRPLEAEKCLSYNRGLFFLSLDKIDCLNKASISIREAEDAIRVVRDLGLVFNALKAPVTGPFTLASRVYIDSADRGLTATCLAKKDLVLEVFSKFVARLIDHVIHLGIQHCLYRRTCVQLYHRPKEDTVWLQRTRYCRGS